MVMEIPSTGPETVEMLSCTIPMPPLPEEER
jgi:hypothetical protein